MSQAIITAGSDINTSELMSKVIDKAKKVKMLICDVDGVMTDGSLFFGDDGQEYKAFNSLDGHGMKMLQQSGVQIAIITGRCSQVVTHRMNNLSISIVYQGQLDKLQTFEQLLTEHKIDSQQIAYIGDDVVDLPVMTRVGLAVAVQNAHDLVKQKSDLITRNPGGHGAVREVCELLMQAQGTYEKMMAPYLS